MNTMSNTSPSAELIQIGGIGFMFEVRTTLKHNLISPDVLAFFEDVQESGEKTKDCAFPLPIVNTNLRQSIFNYIGMEWIVCSDGFFRKCPKVKCKIEYKSNIRDVCFIIDSTLADETIGGFLSLKLL